MASLIEYFYKKDKSDTETSSVENSPSTVGPEQIRATMEMDLRDLTRWIRRVYEELSEENRKLAMQRYEPLEDRINQQYKDGNWAGFQSTMTEAYNLFRGLQPHDNLACRQGGHWIYRAWSRILDAEVWFVCCQKEVSELLQKGIKRGVIYTENELKELVSMPKPAPENIKSVHMVKNFFDSVIVSHEKSYGKS
jgi:hypothetical protein